MEDNPKHEPGYPPFCNVCGGVIRNRNAVVVKSRGRALCQCVPKATEESPMTPAQFQTIYNLLLEISSKLNDKLQQPEFKPQYQPQYQSVDAVSTIRTPQ